MLDSNTDILSYNTSVLRLLGADAAPAENHGSALALNRSAGFRSAVDGALAGRRSEQLLRQNGRCCQVMANPVLRDGEVEGAVVVVLDITEQEERENLRREFTANVSHELKNPPSTSFPSFAEIIQNGIVKPEDIPRFAGNIYMESQRLISLVDDILNLSRLDEADVQLEREDFDLSAVARDVAARLKPAAKKNGVVITTYGDKAMVNGVKSIVDEMVYNLCDNAVKYNKAQRPGHLECGEPSRGSHPHGDGHGHRHPRGGCGPGIRALLPGWIRATLKRLAAQAWGSPSSSMGRPSTTPRSACRAPKAKAPPCAWYSPTDYKFFSENISPKRKGPPGWEALSFCFRGLNPRTGRRGGPLYRRTR